MNLMSNDEVDKLSCIMMKLTSLREKKRTASQKRKLIDTPFAKCLIRKFIYFDIMLSMMKYHQPLLKSLNKLK